VTNIGDFAFFNCNNITSVTIPDSVLVIGDYAFYGCKKMTSVNIPKNVEDIGNNVFNSCGRLASVIAEGEVPPTIGTDVFDGVSSALQISVPSENTEAYRGGVGRLQSFHQMVYA
jgi:hypothetical protein